MIRAFTSRQFGPVQVNSARLLTALLTLGVGSGRRTDTHSLRLEVTSLERWEGLSRPAAGRPQGQALTGPVRDHDKLDSGAAKLPLRAPLDAESKAV